MVYNIVSAIALTALVVFTTIVVLKIVTKTGSERTKYVRSFKQGECAVIYFIAIPLFYMGMMYGGGSWFFSFFNALEASAKMVVLDFKTEDISLLLEDNILYKITILCCFVIGAANSALLFISILAQYISYANNAFIWNASAKKHVMIIGNTASGRKLVTSADKELAYIYDEMSKEDESTLYEEHIRYLSKRMYGRHFAKMIRKTILKKDRDFTIIINTEDDRKNYEYAEAVSGVIVSLAQEKKEHADIVAMFNRLKVFVIRGREYSTLYDEVENKSYGCIHVISRYSQIALDFIEKYPLTKFMGEDILDTSTALVKDDVNINVELFGFGNVNREVFFATVASSQFLTLRDGKLANKIVQYHIFDKDNVEDERELGQEYYRYRDEVLRKTEEKDKYLELPCLPGEEHFYKLDIETNTLMDTVSRIHKDKKSYTYAVISYGADMDNVALAQILINTKHRNNLENFYVFARVSGEASNYAVFAEPNCFAFGDEDELLYNIKRLEKDDINKQSIMRKIGYDIIAKNANSKSADFDKLVTEAEYKWYIKDTPFARKSNLYCVMNYRFKFNAIGLDYVRAEEAGTSKPLSKEEYMSIYCGENRRNLMIMEHYRWCAFHICHGLYLLR